MALTSRLTRHGGVVPAALVVIAWVAALCSPTGAATYYVSPSGTAGGDGSIGDPWSMPKANSDLMPGDTAILLDGSYSTAIVPARSGTPGNPITYIADNSRQAIIGSGTSRINVSSRSYIVVDGVKAENAHRWIFGNGSSHITINDCYFRGASGWESARFRGTGGYITITNSHIENGNDSLHIRESDHHYIAGNTFITDSHTNLIIMGVHNSVVENNTLSNANQKCMEVFAMRGVYDPPRKSEYNLIQNNWFYSGTSSGIQYAGNRSILRRNVYDMCMTGMSWSNYGGTDPTDDPEAWWNEQNRFYNNTIYRSSYGMSASTRNDTLPGLGGLYGDNVCINNIIQGTTTTLVNITWDAVPTQLNMYYNNIRSVSPGQDVFYWEHAPSVDQYKTLAEMESGWPANYADNTEYEPDFVNPAADNFQLNPTSPCIDAGRPLTTTVGAGSGTVVPVADALFFTDGYGLVAPDVIKIGTERVTIVSVNYATNQLTIDRSISWSVDAGVYTDYIGAGPDLGAYENPSPPYVAGRYIFYNNSAFDGNDPAANAADDGAIAPDKQALLPGGTASFANYTSYSKGINGIIVDLANTAGTATASDFAFKVGNESSLSGWAALVTTPAVSVRPGAGADGSDRVTLIWPDNTIEKQWLEVTVKATANTSLAADKVFYFGNAIGDTGNSAGDAAVTPTDEVEVQNSPHTLEFNPAGVEDACDFNRDRKVGPADAVIVRNNATSSLTALQLIAPFENQPPTVDAGGNDSCTLPNGVTLDGTVSDDGWPDPPGAATTTWSKVSGPGSVTFGDDSAVDTTATFSLAGTYVLQLYAYDGEKSGTDTVEIQVSDPVVGVFFEDDFDDNNVNGWTTLAGGFNTLKFLGQPGYEVHASAMDSRMRANLDSASLTDTVYISFKIRHTGGAEGHGGLGWKSGWVWFVDDAGIGFGLYIGLEQSGSGALDLDTTTDDGATRATASSFSAPGPANGNDLKQIELVYDRVNDQLECIYDGVSKGTVSVDSGYRDFTRVVVGLYSYYDGWWGQLNVDDVRIASTP